MYNLLKSIHGMGNGTKTVIAVVLFVFGALLFGFVFLYLIYKSDETDPKNYEAEISIFRFRYDEFRQYAMDCNANAIFIGGRMCEVNGTVVESHHLSMYIVNPSVAVPPPTSLGIEEKVIGGSAYLQSIWKGNYSKTAKRTIVLEVLRHIAQTYPDDLVRIDQKRNVGYAAPNIKHIADFVSGKRK